MKSAIRLEFGADIGEICFWHKSRGVIQNRVFRTVVQTICLRDEIFEHSHSVFDLMATVAVDGCFRVVIEQLQPRSAPPPKRTSPGGARIVFADIPVAPPRCLAMQLIVLVSLRTTPFYGITH